MAPNIPPVNHNQKRPINTAHAFGRRIISVVTATAVWGAFLFGAAGRFDWWQAWAYMGLYFVCLLVNAIAMARYNPALAAERGLRRSGTKRFDKVFAAFYVPTLFIMALVAGLDAIRYEWTALAPDWLLLGVVLQIIGAVPVTWAMATNPHLETTVRIQKERAHKVITTGPYRYVRHPMYLGAILQMLAVPIVLGSQWTFVPAGIIVLLFIIRTALEDTTLQRELPGYHEYTARTHWRLFPGVW
jgi:protein-S-isoprenylcysteine O-methyltransferase Ste14